MIKERRHIYLANAPIISHFAFRPPLIASSDMKNEACFIFPINAQGKIYRQDGNKEVTEKEGVLMKCGQYINKWRGIDATQNSEVVIIRLLPNILEQILDNDIQKSLKENSSSLHNSTTEVVPLDNLLLRYLESLFFYFDNPDLVSDEIARLKIKELILLLLKTPQSNPVKALFARLYEPTKFSLKEIVDANYLEDLSLEEMAALANMSIATFKRKFKQFVGDSPGNYIRHKRLRLAARELLYTKKAVSEIAFDCGFSDPNYFAKAFSKQFGKSPTLYRSS